MEMTWCWRNLFFSFSRAIFRETLAWERSELSYELERVKPPFPLPRLPLVLLRWPIYILYFFFRLFLQRHQAQVRETSTETGRENYQYYCKKQIDNNFPWSVKWNHSVFLNILTSFLWSIRVQIMQNCCLFVKSWVKTIAKEIFQ